jgi:high affinity sulfate transporter 1
MPRLPALGWLRNYQRQWLGADLIAAVTLAAYLVPGALGQSSLAGLPPQAALYACLCAGLVFWLFCSSRHTAVIATSAIALLIGTTVGDMAGGDAMRYSALAAATALLVAALAFAAWLMRAGVIVNFISETVLTGFKAGVAMVLASTQLPKLFGVEAGQGNFWRRMADFLSHLRDTNPAALAVGLSALALLVAGRILLPHRPVALLVVIAGIVVGSVTHIEQRGVKLLGEVPQGLPRLNLPAIHASDINDLLPLAMACFLLGAVETIAVGRMFALKHGHRLDTNRELLALGVANAAAGLAHGLPVSGGVTPSLVIESSGGRTPLASLFASLILVVVVLSLSEPLGNLPQPVLAAVVLMVVSGLIQPAAWRRLWRFGWGELAVAVVSLLGVMGSGMLRGVLIGAILSILLLLKRAARPQTAVLGRVPGTDSYDEIARAPENEQAPGVLVFRVDSAILYFNADYVREAFLEALAAQSRPLRLAVWSLATTAHVDLAGAEMLERLRVELEQQGARLRLCEAREPVRASFRAAGLDTRFGPLGDSISSAIGEQGGAASAPTHDVAQGEPSTVP